MIEITERFAFHDNEEDAFLARIWDECSSRVEFLARMKAWKEKHGFFVGHILVHEHPAGLPLAEYPAWRAGLTERQWESRTVAETHNLLTVSGRTQLLSYVGSNAAVNAPFAQYLAIGTFPIASVSGGDTSVQNEIYRQIPNSAVVTGTQIDVQTVIGASSAVGNWTNCGIYGLTATASSGTGTLMTHALLTYTKTNSSGVSIDYLINLN